MGNFKRGDRGVSTKNIHVSEDTQIHMTTTYSRDGAKPKIDRVFSFVVKGLLISSALVGAVLTTAPSAFADSSSLVITQKPAYTQQESQFKDEAAMITNLRMANKVLSAAIQQGDITPSIYDNVMKKLVSIDTKLVMGEQFNTTDNLAPVLKDTDALLKSAISVNTSNDVLAKRVQSITVLTQVQDRLGIPSSDRGIDQLVKDGVIVSMVNPSKHDGDVVKIASADPQYPTVNVTIDGAAQNFEQNAILKDGSTLVPLRGIFEKLGATVNWNGDTQTVTATKGDTTVKLKIGANYAYVNNKYVTLAASAEIINGSTMVPLRFVSEALGAEVKWDANTTTAIINSVTTGGATVASPVQQSGSGQVVNGIQVKYGKHAYGSNNQQEYDKVMELVSNAIKRVDSVLLSGSAEDEQYYKEYLDGARYDPNASRSMRNLALKDADNALGQLVRNGVDRSTIEKTFKTMVVAYDLLEGTRDPGDSSPKSAYDALGPKKINACESQSQVISATFDAMGYNTAIYAVPGHVEAIVQVGSKWYTTSSGYFIEATLPTSTTPTPDGSGEIYLHTAPTF